MTRPNPKWNDGLPMVFWRPTNLRGDLGRVAAGESVAQVCRGDPARPDIPWYELFYGNEERLREVYGYECSP